MGKKTTARSAADRLWSKFTSHAPGATPWKRVLREAMQANFLEMFAVVGEQLDKRIRALEGATYNPGPLIREHIAVALQPYVRAGFLPEAKDLAAATPGLENCPLPVTFTKSGRWWVASFSGFPGAYSQGLTQAAAYRNLLDAMIDLLKTYAKTA
jgi:hypothetical protein